MCVCVCVLLPHLQLTRSLEFSRNFNHNNATSNNNKKGFECSFSTFLFGIWSTRWGQAKSISFDFFMCSFFLHTSHSYRLSRSGKLSHTHKHISVCMCACVEQPLDSKRNWITENRHIHTHTEQSSWQCMRVSVHHISFSSFINSAHIRIVFISRSISIWHFIFTMVVWSNSLLFTHIHSIINNRTSHMLSCQSRKTFNSHHISFKWLKFDFFCSSKNWNE